MVIQPTNFETILKRYKSDTDSVFNTWFINNEERLKAFRSIKRGVQAVVEDIKNDRFGNNFKGTSLEFVLNCITEQKQVFEGAAHAFYWKPKLRIPDIYENNKNKIFFGQFLENILNATTQDQVLKEIENLDSHKIKGLGPAVANILYFIHPTIVLPFNTAIMNGFNFLFKDKKKLGSWSEYLKIREVALALNSNHKNSLSNDLGDIAGLLFEIGSQRLFANNIEFAASFDREKIESLAEKRQTKIKEDLLEQNTHTEMQHHLLTIGRAFGYNVICAINDKSKSFNNSSFSFMCLQDCPIVTDEKETQSTIKLIDVLWFEKETNRLIAAFEVEKSTSIYSGILRLTDLAFSLSKNSQSLYIVIPNNRENDVRSQFLRPSIKNNKVPIKYILFSDLKANCDALCKFGDPLISLEKIAKSI